MTPPIATLLIFYVEFYTPALFIAGLYFWGPSNTASTNRFLLGFVVLIDIDIVSSILYFLLNAN